MTGSRLDSARFPLTQKFGSFSLSTKGPQPSYFIRDTNFEQIAPKEAA